MKKLSLLLLFIFFKIMYSQEDCNTAISLCGNSAINYTPSGIGNINENLGGCLSSGEHHSVWYKFKIATSGTLTFDLVPTGPVDYDWAIYGPNTTCGNLGFPIRCNASGYLVATGMNMTNTNTTSAGGNTPPYCKFMNVVAGETYYLYLDNWSSTVYTFNLTWGGTATFVSPFASTTTAPFPFIAPGNPNPNPALPNQIPLCSNSTPFDFSTLTTGIVNGNPNFTVHYYNNANDAATGNNPITIPTIVNFSTIYYYTINYNDPNNPTSIANDCKQTGTFTFVNQNLVATISASSSILCPNANLTLSSNYPTGNTWSTGATTQSIVVNAAGTYTLTVNNGTCTSNPTSYTVTNEPNPNVQISGNLVLCTNPTTLTASATGTGLTYSWSNGTTGPTNTVSTPGNYTVTVTTANGCQFQKTVTVTQGTLPVTQNSSLSVCSANPTATFNLTSAQSSISTTPGAVFSFYQNLADANAENTNTIANPTSFNSGNSTIYVLVKVGTCTKVAQLQLIVAPIPTPTITASSLSICNGTAVTLTSNYPTGNSWSTGATTPSISVNTAGTYTLTNTAGSCVSAPVSVTLTSAANPNVQISGNLNFCQGSSTTLTASATGTGLTYLWSNGTTGPINTVSSAGNYTVIVTTSNGCQFQQSVLVNMDPAITVNIANPSAITCNNNQVTLNASSSVFIPGSTIVWTATGGGNIVSGGNTLNPLVNSAGTYTCTITSPTVNGCSSQASVNVVNNINPPIIGLTASSLSVCLGDSVILTASGAQTYTWTGLTGNGNTQTVSPTTTTTYTVTGIGANGCAATNPATITINVVPKIISTLSDASFCKGDVLVLNAGSGPNYTYLWSTGETTPTISVINEGTYTVTISNGVCSKNFSAVVTYKPLPVIENVSYDNSTLVIIASQATNQTLEYSIDGGVNWQLSNTFTNIQSNSGVSIFVRIKGELCSTSINYYTFVMPNIITPNNDGYNDTIDFSKIANFNSFSAEIFDRYGKSIFKATKQNPIWNGFYFGRPLPTASYWYKLNWIDVYNNKPIELSGWILLKTRN